MTRVQDRLSNEEVRLHRSLLPAAGTLTVAFWLVYQLLVPDEWDPLWVRLVISGFVFAPLALSFVSDFVRRNLVIFSFLSIQLIIQWIIVLAAINDFSLTRVVGVILVQYCAGYLFSTVRLNVALHLMTLVGLGIAVPLSPDGLVGGTMAFVTVATASLFNVLWVALYARTVDALVIREEELQQARLHLEERVRERTEELEREVRVRRTAEERAYQASRAKSYFLANMSHELRTPLNAVIGYAELVHEDLDPNHREAREDLQHILNAASYLLTMINDILDLAKVESGAWEYIYEDASVNELVEHAATTVAPLVIEHGNELRIEVESNLPPIQTDRTRLTQVLVNLVNNAAKFTEQGQILVRAGARSRQGVIGLGIDVQDTGRGIPEDQLERVFDKFVQLDSPGSPKRRGTGLGLAIGREMTRGMGGDLTVQSTMGAGSTFSIWLPWRKDPSISVAQVIR
ncbi:MAG: HAMP domain-containing sensor histidine kinase [Myxococcota bacterium]